MKRIIAFSVLAALAICSCQVKEAVEFTPESMINPEAKVFTAVIEDNNPETKTSLDSRGNVLWKQGDQVSIFAGSTINEQYQVTDASDGKTSAALNRVTSPGFVAGTDIDHNVAYYPYASSASIAKDNGSYIISDIELPATQAYVEGSFGNGAFPMTAVTTSADDLRLKFKNVLGGLKLQLTGTAKIASISVTGNSNEILCGAAEVTVSNGSVPSITLTDATAKTVTLDCGEGVQLNTETATLFVIALPPMTMTGGFTVIVTDTEGKQMEIKTTNEQTINRSRMLMMPAVAYEGIPVEYEDPFEVGPNLSVNGTANSYVVTKAGSYQFDASVMGNGPEGFLWTDTRAVDALLWPQSAELTTIENGSSTPAKVFVYWNDGDVINNVTYSKTNKTISFTATGNKGAALIGLFDKFASEDTKTEDEAIWSWLIWCTDSPETMSHTDSDGNQFILMDRNLGATSANPADGTATYGYYFQWGRPAPLKAYIGMARDFQVCEADMRPAITHPTYVYDASSHTLEWYNTGRGHLANVTVDLWGDPKHMYATASEGAVDQHPATSQPSELHKTIYDPCPPGFMVASEKTWELVGMNSDNRYVISFIDDGVIIPTENGDSFYPYQGYISALQSGEVNFKDRLGWYGFKGYQDVLPAEGNPGTMCWDWRTQAAVYTSCTGTYSIWNDDNDPSSQWQCYGAKFIYLSPDGMLSDQSGSLYGSARQRGFPVRCMKIPD